MSYVLGRGKLYFDKFAANTQTKTGERYLGNTPEFNLNISSETLDHFNSDEGIRVKDDSALLELTRAGNFITDHISVENLALFILGEASVRVQEAIVEAEQTIANPLGDRYYQLGESQLNPTGVRDVSNVAVVNATDVALAVNTDYTIDAALGRIYIVEGGGADGQATITVTYDAAARNRDQIITAGSATIEGALRFISANPKGDNRDWFMPYVKLSPNGDFALKGDDWQQIPFNVEIGKLPNLEAVYVDGRAFVVAP